MTEAKRHIRQPINPAKLCVKIRIYQYRLPKEGFSFELELPRNSKQTPKGFRLSGQKVSSQKESKKNRKQGWLSKKGLQGRKNKTEWKRGKFSESQHSRKVTFKKYKSFAGVYTGEESLLSSFQAT